MANLFWYENNQYQEGIKWKIGQISKHNTINKQEVHKKEEEEVHILIFKKINSYSEANKFEALAGKRERIERRN